MTEQSTETTVEQSTEDLGAKLPTITLRDDTAQYLASFDPQVFYLANQAQIDGLFDRLADILGEDPTKPARTIGLLSFLMFQRTKASFDLTTSIALLAGAHASFIAGRDHSNILKLAYVVQELAADRTPFANLVTTNEDEAGFAEGLRQSAGVRIVNGAYPPGGGDDDSDLD